MKRNIHDIQLSQLSFINKNQVMLFKKELNISTVGDLMQHYPFRYKNRSSFHKIEDVKLMPEKLDVQIIGQFKNFSILGRGHQKRLTAEFCDDTGRICVVWFKGVQIILRTYKENTPYILFGKLNYYKQNKNISHPEIEPYKSDNQLKGKLQSVYSLTEGLRVNFISSLSINRILRKLFDIYYNTINEDLPEYVVKDFKLISLAKALYTIHFPTNNQEVLLASHRLKFSELFYNQYQIIKQGKAQKDAYKGFHFTKAHLIHQFYKEHLPFSLTNAQKKVIKEIFEDMKSGEQMNRLLQGDVGSGKTIVAFLCMLIAISNEKQVTLMAPTEVLAKQHYQELSKYAQQMGLNIALLTGSTTAKQRKIIHTDLESGHLNILIGTHALLEEKVKYHALGLAVIDEQHRFGVAQRSKLWKKNNKIPPHILVMTATPIPRTLAMTLYGNLDVSIIDELPANRIPIITKWFYEHKRLILFRRVKDEIAKGRQAYFIYPLIKESEKLDLLHLEEGYENISKAFPNCHLSIVHGGQKSVAKASEMERFKKGETQIMVATTVIEVGVNVPNASIMVIENSERFGLAQLHQLRGRVGRGKYQSYCILMTGKKVSNESKQRLYTMVKTTNGFVIAQKDMELRGPGNISGTEQSGIINFKIANLSTDEKILTIARKVAKYIIENDPDLSNPKHHIIKEQLNLASNMYNIDWTKIS